MRENFTSGSIPFRKAYLQSLIDVIELTMPKSVSKAAKTCSKERSWPAGMVGPLRVRR